jgi:hypothetical protein
VRTDDGGLYPLRILPDRTPEGKLEGAVLMLVDITLPTTDRQEKRKTRGKRI